MVDRITPATSDEDREELAVRYGIRDRWPVVAEPFRQWVAEDRFAGARLPLEDLDVIVTDDVQPYETLKLRLLNAGHSVLAHAARLAGHTTVDQAMGDSRLAALLTRFLTVEAAPVLPSTPGLDPTSYITTLLDRFSNPAMGDQIDRLCADGTMKLPTFVLPTVRQQSAVDGPIDAASLASAAWFQYLTGVDDHGNRIHPAPDPGLSEVLPHTGSTTDAAELIDGLDVFGGLGDNERFRNRVTTWLDVIRSCGTHAAIDRLLST